MLKHRVFKILKYFINKALGSNRKSKNDANAYVKAYYKKKRYNPVAYTKNYWCKNKYWDFFFHSLPHVQADHRFIPRDYYAIVVEPKLKNSQFSDFINEKNYYDLVFSKFDVILPLTYFRCIDHCYLDGGYNRIHKSRALSSMDDICKDVIVKSSLLASGEGVKKYFFRNSKFYDGGESVFNIVNIENLYSGNFLVQELIGQHDDLQKYNPGSLNTLRIVTYRSLTDDNVYVLSVMLRTGVDSRGVDNISAGGIAVSIDFLNGGKLHALGFDKYGNSFTNHPTSGISFEGNRIPNIEKILSVTKSLANAFIHNRIIGWDMTVNNNNEVILIEPNVGIGTWMTQIADGKPLFGDFSDEVRDFIQSKPFWERSM